MGRPPAVTPDEIKEVLSERDKVVLTTGDIAEALDIHRNTAHGRLKKMERDGEVKSDEMGSADVWYLADEDPRVTHAAFSGPMAETGPLVAATVFVLVGAGILVGVGWTVVDVALSLVVYAGLMVLGWEVGGRLETIRGRVA